MNRAAIISVVSVVCTGALLTASCSQTGPSATGNSTSSGGSDSSNSGGEQGGSSSGTTTSNNNQSSGGSSSTSSAAQNGGSSQTDTGANGGASEGGQGSSATGAGGTSSATTAEPTAGGTSSVGKGGAATTATTTAVAAGGKAAGGTSAASGGTSAAAGGSVAKGGTSAASGGTTASASGGTSAATTSNTPTPTDIVPDLAAGFYWEGSCEGTWDAGGHNCPMNSSSSCPSNGINREKVLNVKGTKDQLYTVTIEVRGVIGTRCYTGGKRASTAAPSDDGYNNWWYVGGTYYNSTGWWNTYELKVAPSTGDASGDQYYFNGSDNGGGNYCEQERTFLVKYTASFKVKGGGTMTFKLHDQNCKGQQNCGSNTDPNSTCVPRTVDLAGMSPQPPTTAFAKQPPTNPLNKTYYPQWMWIVATSVSSP